MQAAENLKWYAIRVRSRCEKLAADNLSARGYEVCAAMSPQRRVWVDRVRIVEMPMFPGYIFARLDADRQGIEVERAAGVASVVRFGNQSCPIDDGEIESIQAVLRSGVEVLTSPWLRVGAPVRVRCGALEGAAGVLDRVKSQHRLIISVTLLQRSVAVEIDETLIEPLTTPIRPRFESGMTIFKGVA
jgi:transcription antitermination factor NusG